ncbi:MAG: DUF7133 domain-containing protein [Akkermansiaceae bacterium]
MKRSSLFGFGFSCLLTLSAQAQNQPIYQKGYLSKKEALASIQIPDGYKLQLVLSDPIIKEPVWVVWDGNGAMYVAEMRTYMQDADASGESKPTSRISRHEDTDGDGVYDKHSVFVDNLILPRNILALDDRLIVGTTHTLDLWTYRDTDGDGVADEKIKIYQGGRRGGNMEHQPNGLIWAADNWMYLTYERVRYRYTDGKLIKQQLPSGSGQWGLTQDDHGRIYYSRAGGEVPALGFQQPPPYGLLDTSSQYNNEFKRVYPIDTCPDVQGGPRRLTPTGALNYFTASCGQEIFRGNNLPADLYSDLLIPEPVGRLIRRAKVHRKDAQTTLTNAYPQSEFIRTKDLNFRPVQTTTAPDGTLHIVDMHRGIIQQGNWTRPGSYLRGIIDKWGLDKNIGKGRIYRLVHKDHQPGARPQMLKESTSNLVKHLSHPNGWWRDTSKKLIILRKDRLSVVPALEALASDTTKDFKPRTYALWTLEGMSAVKPELITKLLTDKDPSVQTAALRVSEPFLIKKHPGVLAAAKSLASTTQPEVATQLYNSLTYTGNHEEFATAKQTLLDSNKKLNILHTLHNRAQNRMSQAQKQAELRRKNARLADSMKRGKVIYGQLCHSCHGKDGKGQPMAGATKGDTLAPSLIGSPRVNGNGQALLRVLLDGMTGPIHGKTYPGMMMPMKSNNDQWIADIATYIRNSFGNKNPPITPAQAASVRKQTSTRNKPWTESELNKIEPPAIGGQERWKLTASHNAQSRHNAIDRNPNTRYTSNTSMRPGMWIQIQLPKTTTISGIKLDTRGSNGDYPRGYKVEFSTDGKTWKTTSTGKGKGPITSISVKPTQIKFIRITQTGKHRLYWSIHELTLYGH